MEKVDYLKDNFLKKKLTAAWHNTIEINYTIDKFNILQELNQNVFITAFEFI